MRSSPARGTKDRPALWDISEDPEFLLHVTVTSGVGSSIIGLDRGETGPSLICRAEAPVSADGRGLGQNPISQDGQAYATVIAQNVRYGRSGSASYEIAAAEESFAGSALARCQVTRRDGTLSLDPSALALTDLVGAEQYIADGTGTAVALDPGLSRITEALWYGDILAVEAELTFVPRSIGVDVPPEQDHSPRSRQRRPLGTVVPHHSVTIRQQIALRCLPEPAEPLPFDARSGSTPGHGAHRFDRIGERDALTPFASRFDLDRGPIVFHLDPAVPEPLRTAALTGGNWWRAAFTQAGFPEAFRCELLDEDADWRDPRLNVILWVHRADRGWSYGMTHTDPRTGEILRGLVRIGSQRIEEVRAIAESVLAPYSPGADRAREQMDRLIGARMRQLVAHETGHALGFAHNFAAHRHPVPSVMDYPAPDFGVEEPGIPCAREPYAEGPGPWDVAQIRLIYGNQAPGDVVKPELCYLTDADGRTPATASATAATWVVPAGPQAGLRQVLAVRASALRRFGPGVLPPGSRPHELQRRFAMIYLLHRHQVVYVVKQVSGTRRSGDPAAGYPEAMEFVPAEEQAAALRTLADLISPAFLRIEDQVLSQILPYGDESEPIPGGFSHRTAGTFDISEAVGAATDVVASPLLAPERLNRLAQQAGLGGVGLAPVLELTVDYAAGLADDPRDTVSEAIAWTLLARLERSLRSPGLHAEPRSAVMDRCDAAREDARRPALRRRLEKLIRAAEENERLPRVPLGVPI